MRTRLKIQISENGKNVLDFECESFTKINKWELNSAILKEINRQKETKEGKG
jgi:hypothetical protein